MTPLGALIAFGLFAALIVLWSWDRPSVPSVYARLRPSPSRRGAGLPPGSAPAGDRASIPRVMDTIAAFNEGEHAVAELIGAEKAREMFARQEAVAACRRRAASNRDLLDMRLD